MEFKKNPVIKITSFNKFKSTLEKLLVKSSPVEEKEGIISTKTLIDSLPEKNDPQIQLNAGVSWQQNVALQIIKKLKDTNIGSYPWYISKGQSVYIRFDDPRMGSIRIADHKAKEKYKYKFNITNEPLTRSEKRNKTKKKIKWIKNNNVWQAFLHKNYFEQIIPVLIDRKEQVKDFPVINYAGVTNEQYKQLKIKK